MDRRGRKKHFEPVGMRFGGNRVLEQLGNMEYRVACDCGNTRVLKGCSTATLKRLKGCKKCYKGKFYPRAAKEKRPNRVDLFFTDQHYDALSHIAYQRGYRHISEFCRMLLIKNCLTQEKAEQCSS